MEAAARRGYQNIVELMLSHGANDFNRSMEVASRGHQNIVYLDANGLCGWAMSMPLPTRERMNSPSS